MNGLLPFVIDRMKREEGSIIENQKHVPYQDHLGYWTIGYGKLIDSRLGGGLSEEQAERLLELDIQEVINTLQKRMGVLYGELSHSRQAVLIDMTFNLGAPRFLGRTFGYRPRGFLKMWEALKVLDYKEASLEILDSKYARKDAPNRAERNAKAMRNNIPPYHPSLLVA